ncbi:MAG: DUF6497 family protein [Pseudomonadota bacterium]
MTASDVRLTVPSNQPLEIHETILVEPERDILYIGLVAPMLGGATPVTFDRAIRDIDSLCETLGLPLAAEAGGDLRELVIRLMERPIDYGTVDPGAAQFSNAYDISDGACQWY